MNISYKVKWEQNIRPRFIVLAKNSDGWAQGHFATYFRYGNAITSQSCPHCNLYLPILEETLETLETLAVNNSIDISNAETDKCIKDSIVKLVELNMHLYQKHQFTHPLKYRMIGVLLGLIGLCFCFIYEEFLFGIFCFMVFFFIGRYLDMQNILKGKSIG